MNKKETALLVRYIKSLCPQQAIDDYTYEAWHDVIGHLDFTECQEAIRDIVRRQPFVAPSEIIAEVAAKRGIDLPHSHACRSGDHQDCRVSWCNCHHHPAAVKLLTAHPDNADYAAALARIQARKISQEGTTDAY